MADRKNNNPIKHEISDFIRQKIKESEFKPGQKIPTNVILADQFKVSRKTVQFAVMKLEQEGLLKSWVGQGTFVTEDALKILKKGEKSVKIANIAYIVESQNPVKASNPFDTKVIEGVAEKAVVKGFNLSYHVITIDSYQTPAMLSSRAKDGIIISSIEYHHLPDFYHDLKKSKIPYILLGAYPRKNEHSVLIDEKSVGSIAGEHLTGLEHRRLGIVSGHMSVMSYKLRYENFKKTVASKGLRIKKRDVFILTPNWKNAYKLGKTLDPKDLPQAFFVCEDMMAAGLITAFRERGIHVPGQVSILGVDDLPQAVQIVPDLSTIQVPLMNMGTMAVDILEDIIKGKREIPQISHVPVKLILRGTTRKAKAAE